MKLTPKAEIEKLRIRLLRWHGQIMRCDRSTWTLLKDANFLAWKNKVRNRLNDFVSYEVCIRRANLKELQKLDCLILEEKLGI